MADRKPASASASAKKLDPAQSPRAMYGAELRFQRERAGLSQAALGELLFVGNSLIAKMESGERRIQPDMAEQLDRVLDAGGFFVRNLAAARATPYQEHFADVAELETFALTIREWDPTLVPGLLQIPAYTLAIIRGYDPVVAAEVVSERQAARLARAEIFNNPGRPVYWAVLDESVIRRPCGGATVMAAQLRHLCGMIRNSRIIVQIVPYSAGSHAGMGGALKLMTFEVDTPVAYAPGQESGSLIDDPATFKRCSFTYDLLAAAALSPEASLTLMEAVAEEYEHGSQRDGGDVA
jgi:transcriptional regulator with XRE-family HTH domain